MRRIAPTPVLASTPTGLSDKLISAIIPYVGLLAIPLFLWWIYMAIRGKTPGRNIVGLEIVDAAGEEMSFGRGILREIVGKFISGIFFYLGYIWVAFDERKQGWHDKIAGTYVVRK